MSHEIWLLLATLELLEHAWLWRGHSYPPNRALNTGGCGGVLFARDTASSSEGVRDPVATFWRLGALRSEPGGSRAALGRGPRGCSGRGETSPASDPSAELLLLVPRQRVFAAPRRPARLGGPRGARQDRAQSPDQERARGRCQHQKRRQREESQHDERRRAAV